jgi:hypothetical protein
MDEFNENPLDLLEDDGDGVIETCLFFDEDEKDKPPGGGGCCVVFLAIGTSIGTAAWGISKWMS